MVTLEEQLTHEEYFRDLGRATLALNVQKAQEQGRATDTPLGLSVLRRYLLKLSRSIAHDITDGLGTPGRSKQYVVLLENMDTDVLALVALDEVINTLASHEGGEGIPMTSLGARVGRAVHSEILLTVFNDISPDLFEVLTSDLRRRMSKDLRHKMTIFKMQATKNGLELPEWTTQQRVQVGLYLVGQVVETGLIDMFTAWVGGKSQHQIRLGDKATDIMQSVRERMEARAGFTAPCLIPPQDWTGEDGVGGYHGALKIRAVRFFKGSSEQWEIMQTEGTDNSVVLRMLNYHQKTAWKVNPFIQNVVNGLIGYGYEIEDSVTTTDMHPKPRRPEWLDYCENVEHAPIKDQNEFADWKASVRDWHTSNKKRMHTEVRMRLALSSAKHMSQYGQFFFPHQIDDRSRMYAVSGPLNPQGSDLQKALLHSAVGGPIDTPEALAWFKLSLAAKYGIDKLSPEDCIKWVDDNHDNIISAATDPLNRDAFSWWSEADKPLQFIAVCDEYRRYHEDPVGFTARIAVAMDGTCNGLQNYSALLRDSVGGRATNLISAQSGIPNDIYADVAKAAFSRLLQSHSPYRDGWEAHGFNRKLTKPSVMTQVYGSTFGTCRKSIVAYSIKCELFTKDTRYSYSDFAAHLVWDGIGDVVVKAKECMDWLRKSAGAIMKEGATFISWPAPSGFRVVQIYNKSTAKRVKAHVGKQVYVQLQLETDVPDKMRHRNAFPPNFIHSVDGSHMAFTTCGMEEVGDSVGEHVLLHFIHDDFGALPHMAVALARVIREKFVEMHENYDIESIRNDYWFLKPPPAKGDLDIRCVLDSVNFFR